MKHLTILTICTFLIISINLFSAAPEAAPEVAPELPELTPETLREMLKKGGKFLKVKGSFKRTKPNGETETVYLGEEIFKGTKSVTPLDVKTVDYSKEHPYEYKDEAGNIKEFTAIEFPPFYKGNSNYYYLNGSRWMVTTLELSLRELTEEYDEKPVFLIVYSTATNLEDISNLGVMLRKYNSQISNKVLLDDKQWEPYEKLHKPAKEKSKAMEKLKLLKEQEAKQK